jgi:hypothetical protein
MKTIHVTQEDIDKGIRGDCKRCPVARAIERELPSASDIEVHGYIIAFWYDGEYIQIKGSGELARFVYEFDDGKKLKPFEFTLDNI